MIRSMTGFGTGTATDAGWRADITIRTLNHRYLSIRIHSLHDRPQLETRVHDEVKKAFQRGEIGVWVTITRDHQAPEAVADLFDGQTLRDYITAVERIAKEYSLARPPCLGDLIQLGAFQTAKKADDELWPLIEGGLKEAMDATHAARVHEGAFLTAELERVLEHLTTLLSRVKERVPMVTEMLRQRLEERIASLNLEIVTDPNRVETEVAFLAERADVQEEAARLDAHLARAEALLYQNGPVGRELDFLSQELLREVNTLGAKARDLDINALVVDMKVEIERFKEQVQNVE